VGRADPGEPPADGAPDDDPVDALPEDDPPEAPDDKPLEPPGDDEAPEEAPSAEPPSSLPVLATLPPHDATPDTMRATTVRYNRCVGRRGIVMSLQEGWLVLRLRGTARHRHHLPPTSTIESPRGGAPARWRSRVVRFGVDHRGSVAMSDPPRLLRSGPSALERTLLDGSACGGPTDQQCATVWAALQARIASATGDGGSASAKPLDHGGGGRSGSKNGFGAFAKVMAAASAIAAASIMTGMAVRNAPAWVAPRAPSASA
jgi:hypothetical protein